MEIAPATAGAATRRREHTSDIRGVVAPFPGVDDEGRWALGARDGLPGWPSLRLVGARMGELAVAQ